MLRESYDWLKNEFGEEHVISAVIHKDETNMHLHFDFVLIKGGKLIAKSIISKPKLHQYQNEFLKHLQDKKPALNFERGGTNGLSQRNFEVMQEERKKLMQEIAERENELDAREDELERREDELSDKEKKYNNTVEEFNKRVKEFNERVNEFKVEKNRND